MALAGVMTGKGRAVPRIDQQAVTRSAFRVLAARVAADWRTVDRLADVCDLQLRVWEAGTRGEAWRLVVVQRTSGREYQVQCWADWERMKQLAVAWLPNVERRMTGCL